MKFMSANRIAPDGTGRFAASHLGLFCLPMSYKKDALLIWVNRLHNMNGCMRKTNASAMSDPCLHCLHEES